MVQGLASATSLLSLNAAIQAAHAGQHGKGFAIIASEIRKLSTQTSQAINEISITLNEIQASTKDSATTMDLLTEKINDIVQTSSQISKLLENIHTTTLTTERHTSEMAHLLESYVGTTDEVSNNVLSVKK